MAPPARLERATPGLGNRSRWLLGALRAFWALTTWQSVANRVPTSPNRSCRRSHSVNRHGPFRDSPWGARPHEVSLNLGHLNVQLLRTGCSAEAALRRAIGPALPCSMPPRYRLTAIVDSTCATTPRGEGIDRDPDFAVAGIKSWVHDTETLV